MLQQGWEIKRREKNSLKYFYWYLKWKYTDTFAKIREALQSKIVYKHIVINDFIQVNNHAMFMAIIKHMIERVPFHLKDYSISLKLPSVSPHSVVHFLWEKPNNDSADCQEQLNLKNESKDLSFPSNKHEVKKRFPYQATQWRWVSGFRWMLKKCPRSFRCCYWLWWRYSSEFSVVTTAKNSNL